MVVVVTPYHCRAASNESGAGSGLYRSRRLTSVVQDVAATKIETSNKKENHFTRSMQTEAQHAVNTLILYRGDDAEFLSCACLWCEEIPAPSGAMD